MNLPRPPLLFCLLLAGGSNPPPAPPRLERIIVSPDSHGFVLAPAGPQPSTLNPQPLRPFHPWGFNYGNAGRLMEDFWDTDWQTFADDFRKMKALGANVVRVHLQYGKFMAAPASPVPGVPRTPVAGARAFQQLSRMLRLAEQTGLYLDITGLACYRPGDTPKWYDAMDEPQRWAAQSNFWQAVARTCASSPAVFCYDLMNEPISPGDKRAPGTWRSGSLFGDYDFLQFITLDPAGRNREDIPVQWIRLMTAAIRSRDTNALITVGLLPWSEAWGHLSGFVPEKIAPELDFLSVHIYPDSKKPAEAMTALRKVAVGKPVVLEETFPLSCSTEQEEAFLRESKAIACGWIGHYDGLDLADFARLDADHKLTIAQSIYRNWQQLFVKLKPSLAP